MTAFIQKFGLTRGTCDLGVSCNEAGLALAGVSLLRNSAEGFAPRPANEIETLIRCAYLRETDLPSLMRGLSSVAKALNAGELAGAMIAAVHLRLPELDVEGAARIANADDTLVKYDLSEPRDWHGRWARNGGTAGPKAVAPHTISDLIDVAYQGHYHDQVVAQIAALAKADGAKVITSVNLVAVNGATARADLIIIPPSGEPLILLEVKTGEDPGYTKGQRVVYPMAQIGNHVFSPDSKITELGFAPGQLLPAMYFETLYKKDEASPFIPLPGEDPQLP